MTLHKSPDSPLSWLNALTASKPTGPILQAWQKLPPLAANQRPSRPGSANQRARPAGAGGRKEPIGRNLCGWHIRVLGGTNLFWPILLFTDWYFLDQRVLLCSKAFWSLCQRYFWSLVRPQFEIGLRATRVGLLCATISQFRGNLGQKWAPVHLITSNHTSLNKQTTKQTDNYWLNNWHRGLSKSPDRALHMMLTCRTQMKSHWYKIPRICLNWLKTSGMLRQDLRGKDGDDLAICQLKPFSIIG